MMEQQNKINLYFSDAEKLQDFNTVYKKIMDVVNKNSYTAGAVAQMNKATNTLCVNLCGSNEEGTPMYKFCKMLVCMGILSYYESLDTEVSITEEVNNKERISLDDLVRDLGGNIDNNDDDGENEEDEYENEEDEYVGEEFNAEDDIDNNDEYAGEEFNVGD